MLQPIDSASVIEGAPVSPSMSALESLPNKNRELLVPSTTSNESYLVSSPVWLATSSTVVPNKDGHLIFTGQRESTTVAPVVQPLLVDVSRRSVRVQALQRWTGVVEKVIGDRFIAVISDVTTPANPAEEVELDVNDVSPSDRTLVAPGAVFYWAITYRDTKGGQRERIATIRFARQPKLTELDIREIFIEAEEIADLLERE